MFSAILTLLTTVSFSKNLIVDLKMFEEPNRIGFDILATLLHTLVDL